MEYTNAKKISDFLKDKNIRDIAIAIMNIEQNNNGNFTKELYDKYLEQYNKYFHNRDDLTGILNDVLQNSF